MAEKQRYPQRRFYFVGETKLGKDIVKSGKGKVEWKRISIGVKKDTSVAFVQMLGSKQDVIKTYSKGTKDEKGKELEVKWDDRLKGEVIDDVASFKKIVVNFGVKKEFITQWDAIEYINQNINLIKDQRIYVRGDVVASTYKDNTQLSYEITEIGLASEEQKDQLRVTLSIFFDKGSLDKGAWKTEKRAFVNGWVRGWNRELKQDTFYAQTFIVDATKIEFDNPKHEKYVKMVEFLVKQFEITKKGIYELAFECNLVRGAEEEEISMDDLNSYQKMQVEMGMISLDDIKKAMGSNMFGPKLEELRLARPHASFTEGAELTDYTEEDFVVAKDAVKEEVVSKSKVEAKQEVKETKNDDVFDGIDIDDLPF